MINRKELVNRHNPKLSKIDLESPMTVGNGECAFTADVTGFQSLYNEYLDANAPLCTMSQWGWHTEPAENESGSYSLNDVEMTRFNSGGKLLDYAVECKPGNEKVYNWLRHNPHRLNLAKISLIWGGAEISGGSLLDIKQELDLYTGVLYSNFKILNNRIRVRTVFAQNSDIVGFSVESNALSSGLLKVKISFPYGSHKISASDWQNEERHKTVVLNSTDSGISLIRTLDREQYFVEINGKINTVKTGIHEFVIQTDSSKLEFTAAFSQKRLPKHWSFGEVLSDSEEHYREFWQNGGSADFSRSKDPRWIELERRTVLSQYLTAVHSAGSIPPQETGLACNSWYGKFHLEMHILHSGWFPLWNRSNMLEKSFDWYIKILDNAKANAARNGYNGARWPKMTGPGGIDSPSRIATLLIWQQPHILYMLELVRKSKPKAEQEEFMNKHWCIVSETATFIADFAKLNSKTGKYDLPAPLIPAQEEHNPKTTVNPSFELCYWRFGLNLAVIWANILGKNHPEWQNVLEKLADPPISGGIYTAHKNCPDTFESFNRDHPSMLYGFGFIPCEKADKKIMSDTFDKVMDSWDFGSLWGWDFALMAMTLTRLGRPDLAVDVLLMPADKNTYVASGNNYQRSRNDLPLYLPGNGSLLLALSMMLAGYGENRDTPGFPKNGLWDAEFEGISPLPY